VQGSGVRSSVIVALCASIAVTLGACGSDESSRDETGNAPAEKVLIDVGTDKPIEAETTKPRIGYLWTSGSVFMDANRRGVEDEAKRRGLDVTVFDAKFDPLRQVEQVQNVLQQDRFDALIVIPLDYNTLCPTLTKQAPAEGVVVVTQDITMCGLVTDEGPEAAAPGTLAHAGFPAATDANRHFFSEVAARRGPGKHVGALLVGPQGNSSSEGTVKGLEQVRGEIADKLEVPYVIYTDFTTPDSLAKVQTLLQAHPEVDTIMTNYSDETLGAIRAVKAAGLEDKVKIYDQGGSTSAIEAIKAGDLAFTTAFHPYNYGVDSVAAIADAFEGKPVDRFFGGYPDSSTEEGLGKRLIIDETNVDEFEPEY
jgi:ribose transport system substrate-binding protein